MKAILLTVIQFTSLGILVYLNDWPAGLPLLAAVQFVGLLLGLWAIYAMSKSKLNITPVPRKGAVLIHSGPYRLIRHPMYTSLMLMVFPVLYDNHGITNLLVTTILFVNLLLKLAYEEQLLRDRFEGYDAMTGRTWRLIPWIW